MSKLSIWRGMGSDKHSCCEADRAPTKRDLVRGRRHQKLLRAIPAHFEMLEDRRLMSLLGITPGYPSIPLDTDTSTMKYTYNATTHQGTLLASGGIPSPVTISPGVQDRITGGTFTIDFLLNPDGTVVAGQTGASIELNGSIPALGASGVLLEGTISQFGFQYNGTGTNNFDATFVPTVGALEPYFANQSIGISFFSQDNTFTGSFTSNWAGGGNNTQGVDGVAGPIPPIVTVGGNLPTITTTPGGTVILGSGAKLHDTATLSGGVDPTGTITFELLSPSNAVVDMETVPVNGNGNYSTPNGYAPTTSDGTGTYEWIANYSGDAANQAAASPLGSEPEVVSPASPAINTIPGGPVVIGSGTPLTDTAYLSGGDSPTGTITFSLYSPTNVLVETETVNVTGNGSYSTPNGYVPTIGDAGTGTYEWAAAYSGDANNNPVSSPATAEPEVVSPASPAINTIPGGPVVIGSGTPLTDTAYLSGGDSPTGTITFSLYSPTNVLVETETVNVTGNGSYSTPTGYVPTVGDAGTGTYEWAAAYSGDANNNPVSSPATAELEVVSAASPAINTIPGGPVVIGSGTPLTDTAYLSGGDSPTGTITFSLYSPTNVLVETETVNVTGNGSYSTPNGYVPTIGDAGTGTYEWAAAYSGDANNNPVSSPATAELEVVSAASPAINTIPGGPVVIGSGTPLTDTAYLSGGDSPTGTITFSLYSPTNVLVETEIVNVTGNGSYSTPTGYVPTVGDAGTGTYEWAAAYSGDANNNPVSSPATAELEVVSAASPAINTIPGGPVVIGSGTPLTDTAYLSGGDSPTGTITFSLYSPTNVLVETETVNVTGNGSYSTPTGYVPTVGDAGTGTYEWAAAYSGDANNNPVSSPATAELEVVSAASPAINTIPGGPVVIGSGTPLTDTAYLSGGDSPTGTITFSLYSPTNVLVETETVNVTGNGSYSTPNGYVPTIGDAGTGTYEWAAAYSGDANNNPVSSPATAELEVVSAASPAINTIPGGPVVIGSGTPLTDTAYLSGGDSPTGTITFSLYSPTNVLVETEIVNVTGNGSYSTPTGYVPTVGDAGTGTYEWAAAYSGDANNNPVSSPATAELEVVSPASPAINTIPGGPVVIGSGTPLTDTAYLSGGDSPTGTITFSLYSPTNVLVETEIVNVTGNGSYSTPTGYVPTVGDAGTGTYEWAAAYSGDSNNNPVSSPATAELEVVSAASPAITTTPGGTIVLGSGAKLTDTAILSGGVSETGTITFTLYSPSNAVVTTETVTVTGNGSYSTPTGIVPAVAGTYEWAAAYSGDSNNNPVSSPATAELEVVSAASPAITTTPGGTIVLGSGAKLTDTAILSGGVSETGTITFTLYSPSNAIVTTETVTVTGNGSYSTPTGIVPAVAGTYEWAAAYSGDSNNNPVSSPATAELEVVSAASPAITTTPGGTIVLGSGAKLTDTAILSGGVSETGTITFTLYSPSNAIVTTETVTVTGNGSYSTPTGIVPAVAGTYEWAAAYSGDSNNNPVSSPKTAELEVVSAASPAITTTPGGTIVLGSGAKLTDTAILSGGVSETGTITFTLYSPSNAVVTTETVTVTGNGSYSTPTGIVPAVAGTYEWAAAYSGDANNNPVSSPATAELEVVSAASPAITTTPGGTIVLGSGAKLTDTAILSGGVSETGTITFTLYSPSNAVVTTETVTVTGNGSYSTPTGIVPAVAGTYEWAAAYSGDSNNNPVSSPKTAELEVVSAASPAITTTPGGTIVLGSGTKLTDTAILSGGVSETGTITFTLYSPSNAVVTTETVTVTGNGSYSTPTGIVPAVAGTYEWAAAYSGDSNNNPVSSPATAELEVVSAASPAITTTPGGTIVLGSGAKLTDTAILSGGVSETGTITFTLYSPSNAVVTTETVTVTGNGSYSTPTGIVPAVAGTYEWAAAYSGDSNNNAVSSPKTAELEVVTSSCPAITTTPGGTIVLGSGTKLTDTAILSGGTNPTGTITFTLYSPSNTVVDTETVTVTGNGTYSTPNGFLPTATTGTGTYEWAAVYSGDSNNAAVSSPKTAELECVTAASPAITTTPGGSVVLGSGSKLTDTAVLSGGVSETGTITFTLYSPSNAVVDTETVTVTGNGTYSTPNGFLPTTTTGAGTYEWAAAYSGDSNNNAVSSPKTAELEVVTQPAQIDLNVTKTVCDIAPTCDISCNFNGTPCVSGDYIWFDCDLNPTIPTGCNSVTYNFTSCQINFTAAGKNYCVNAPNSCVTFSNTCTAATTTYNSNTNCWTTVAPCSGTSGNTFFNGCEFKVPTTGLPGGVQNVCWTGNLTDTAPNCSANWQWGAACYDQNFCTNYSNLNVKPCDDVNASCYKNSDHCGTPEACKGTDSGTGKSYLCGGGTGGGGSNYTGSCSSTQSCNNLCMCSNQTNIGDTVLYTVTVSNAAGYSTATGVVLSDLLPSGISFVSATPSQGTYTASTGVWTIGTINSGSTVTLQVYAKTTAYGCFVNTATVTAANQPDVNSNPTASVMLDVGSDDLMGTVYNDTTGNGLTSDDTALAGVVVNLYKDVNGNGVLDSSDGAPVATVTVGANGVYSFTNLAFGKYIITETVPTGYTETAPNLPNYYAVTVSQCTFMCGLNFDNYHACTTPLQNVTFTVQGSNAVYTTLAGNVAAGETVTAHFTVPTGASPMIWSLVSYNAPDAVFNANDASEQTIYQVATGTFGPGAHTLTVTIPNNDYQIDFVCGTAINTLGPAGSNIFYSAQGRLISSNNGGGVDALATDDTATIGFWQNNNGQALLDSLNGGSTATGLSGWLSSNFPNLYAALAGDTNAQVASYYVTLFGQSGQKTPAQIMSAALAVYATTPTLAGGSMASSYGFIVTNPGSGFDTTNVGTQLSSYGGPTGTQTILEMLNYVNSVSSNGTIANGNSGLLNVLNTIFSNINQTGDIS